MRLRGTPPSFTSIVAIALALAAPQAALAAPGDPVVNCQDLPCGVRCCEVGGLCEDDPVPAGTVCRGSAGACDPAETCDGFSAACPPNALASAATVCRPAAGICDSPETCTGTSAACPQDGKKSAGTVCRGAAGGCDVVEVCNGTTNVCPADAVQGHGYVCRPLAGACDVEEVCDGDTAACPAAVLEPPTTTCRPAAGPCDAPESCTGASASCPPDTLLASGTVCRAAANACDEAESCSGTTAVCPADAIVADGVSCDAASACLSGGTCAGGVCFGGTRSLSLTPAEAVVTAGSTTTLTVTHSGSGGPLSLTGATLDSDAFELVEAPAWPVTLATGESATFGVRVVETAPGSYAATVSVATDGCDEPTTADVSAELTAAQTGGGTSSSSDGGSSTSGGGSSSGGCGQPAGNGPAALAWFLAVVFGLRMLRRARQ